MHHHTVNVEIDNRVAYLSRPYDYEKLIKYWSHSVDNYQYIVKSRPHFRKCRICGRYPGQHKNILDHEYIPIWDGKAKFLKRDSVPAGLFLATYKDIEKDTRIRFRIHEDSEGVRRTSRSNWIHSRDEYSFQNECVGHTYESARNGKGGLVLNATGSGKTRVAAMVASRLKCDLLFIVDQLVLLKQAQKDIAKHLGERVGKVGESEFYLERVTVATIQTLHLHRKDRRFLQWYRNVQVIFIDELHEAMNKSNFDVVAVARPLAVFGLTATLGLTKKPVRLKAYSLCGPVIYEYPITRGMEEGVLEKGITVQIQYENSIKNLKKWTQQKAYNKRIVKNGERNYIITQLTHRAVKKGKYVVIVVERLKHLEEISERLKALHIKHKVVAGTYKGKGIKVVDRFKSKDKFEEGSIKCLVVNKVFKKGIDIKRLDLIINGTGKPSVNDSIQIFGRGVRRHKDKKGLIHFDISDFDSRDKERRLYNKEHIKNKRKLNWLAKAAKRRGKALKKIGITTHKIVWNDEMSFSDILKQSERWLKKELHRAI